MKTAEQFRQAVKFHEDSPQGGLSTQREARNRTVRDRSQRWHYREARPSRCGAPWGCSELPRFREFECPARKRIPDRARIPSPRALAPGWRYSKTDNGRHSRLLPRLACGMKSSGHSTRGTVSRLCGLRCIFRPLPLWSPTFGMAKHRKETRYELGSSPRKMETDGG
jgi:hypothetical protein